MAKDLQILKEAYERVIKENEEIYGGADDGAEIGAEPQRAAEDYVDAIEVQAQRLSGFLPRNGFFDANEEFMKRLAAIETELADLNEIVFNNTDEMK
jgi:hypothetical protein